MKLFFRKNSKAGESLVEVIMAIFVIGIGVGVATTLIVTALQSNNFSRDNLIAMNLATEGIEAIRSIRDTNWLKYGFDRENCWNLIPTAPCQPSYQTIQSGHYVPYLDTNDVWQLAPIADGPLDLENSGDVVNAFYQLKMVNLFGAGPSEPKFFVPQTFLCNSPCVPLASDAQNLRFYRMIEIVNEPNDVQVENMKVQSLVEWKLQGVVHKILLTTQLTNYQR